MINNTSYINFPNGSKLCTENERIYLRRAIDVTAVALVTIAALAFTLVSSSPEDAIVTGIFVYCVIFCIISNIFFGTIKSSQRTYPPPCRPNFDHSKYFFTKNCFPKTQVLDRKVHVTVGGREEGSPKGLLDVEVHAPVGRKIKEVRSLDTDLHAAVGGGVQRGKEEHAPVGKR